MKNNKIILAAVFCIIFGHIDIIHSMELKNKDSIKVEQFESKIKASSEELKTKIQDAFTGTINQSPLIALIHGYTFSEWDRPAVAWWQRRSPIHMPTGHTIETAVKISDNLIAIGAKYNTIFIYDLAKQEFVARLEDQRNPMPLTATTLATRSKDGSLNTWDITDLNNPARITMIDTNKEWYQTYLSVSENIIASVGYKRTTLYHIDTKQVCTQDNIHKADAFCLTSYQDNITTQLIAISSKLLASSSDIDKTIKLWDITDVEKPPLCICTITNSENITALAKISDTVIASGTKKGSILFWDITDPNNPKCIGQFKQNEKFGFLPSIRSIVIVSDNIIAVTTQSRTINFYDVSDAHKPLHINSLPATSGNIGIIPITSNKFIGLGYSTIDVYEAHEKAQSDFDDLSQEDCKHFDALIQQLEELSLKRACNTGEYPRGLIPLPQESLNFFKSLPQSIQDTLHSNYLITLTNITEETSDGPSESEIKEHCCIS